MHPITVPNDRRFGRIRDDIQAGRLWRARDRLQGHLRQRRADQVVLRLLGEVHYAMGDLPQAGRHWWLTERDDEPAQAARAAFYERFGVKAAVILQALPRPAGPEEYPGPVRTRLEALVTAAAAEDYQWRPFGWTPPEPEDDWGEPWRQPLRDRVTEGLAVALVLSLLALAVVGFVTAVGWVLDALR